MNVILSPEADEVLYEVSEFIEGIKPKVEINDGLIKSGIF